jgi:predicted extracellular nuclease
VASANVLNYFTTFTNGTDDAGNSGQGCTLGSSTSASNCRGADNLNEFTRQTAKIVGELKAINADGWPDGNPEQGRVHREQTGRRAE